MDRRGFSLLELIVVVSILTILTTAVAPVFHESLKRSKREDAVRNLVATMRYAQERAVSDSTEYRVYLDPEKGAYWVARLAAQDGSEKTFGPAPEPFLRRAYLPEGFEMRRPKAERDRDEDAYYIAFYPHGACDYATVSLRSDDRDYRVRISTKGMLGRFDVEVNR